MLPSSSRIALTKTLSQMLTSTASAWPLIVSIEMLRGHVRASDTQGGKRQTTSCPLSQKLTPPAPYPPKLNTLLSPSPTHRLPTGARSFHRPCTPIAFSSSPFSLPAIFFLLALTETRGGKDCPNEECTNEGGAFFFSSFYTSSLL